MWVVRELLRLLETTHAFQVSCLVVGAVLLLMGAIGRNNNFERRMDYGITEKAWGRIPGVSTMQRRPEDPTLTPGAVFAGAGIAMLAIGMLV